MKMLGVEWQHGTSGQEESALKEGKRGEKNTSAIDDAPWNSKWTSMNHELESSCAHGEEYVNS